MTLITVSFGTSQRTNDEITAGCINEQKRARERDGVAVCAIVRIQGGRANLALPVGQCGPSGGGGHPPNDFERELIELWRRLHLDGLDFSTGNLQAFIKQTSRLS